MPVGVIPMPDFIKARPGSDFVTYHANGKKFVKKACYAEHMIKLHQIEFFLEPCDEIAKRTAVPGEYYLKWVDLFKIQRLFPKGVTAEVKENNLYMHIPKFDHLKTKYRIYNALCCYRFAESNAPMVYTTIELMNKYPHMNFWQALHYSSSVYVQNSGHHFLPIDNYNYENYMGEGTGMKHIGLGLACGWLFRQKEDYLIGKTSYTTSIVGKLSNSFTTKKFDKKEEILENKYISFFDLVYKQYDEKKMKKAISKVLRDI